jgi:acyl carrier protein
MSEALDPEFARVLRDVLSKVSPREMGEFLPHHSLDGLGLDSVSRAEVVVMLEDEWDVVLQPHEIGGLETFGQLQELVLRAKKAI